jgi:hypothetical protein
MTAWTIAQPCVLADSRDQRLPADDAATDQEQQAQAIGLFLTDRLLEI